MKKFIALILALVLCFSLCACSSGGGKEESINDKVESAVRSQITATLLLKYDTTGVPVITYYIDEVGENEFEVTGKVTVKDKYGDSYTGKYDAEVEYDPETDDCDVDCEIGKLYKQ